jgi:hypothetical protein
LRNVFNYIATRIRVAFNYAAMYIDRTSRSIVNRVYTALKFVSDQAFACANFISTQVRRVANFISTQVRRIATFIATQVCRIATFIATQVRRVANFISTQVCRIATFIATHVSRALTYVALRLLNVAVFVLEQCDRLRQFMVGSVAPVFREAFDVVGGVARHAWMIAETSVRGCARDIACGARAVRDRVVALIRAYMSMMGGSTREFLVRVLGPVYRALCSMWRAVKPLVRALIAAFNVARQFREWIEFNEGPVKRSFRVGVFAADSRAPRARRLRCPRADDAERNPAAIDAVYCLCDRTPYYVLVENTSYAEAIAHVQVGERDCGYFEVPARQALRIDHPADSQLRFLFVAKQGQAAADVAEAVRSIDAASPETRASLVTVQMRSSVLTQETPKKKETGTQLSRRRCASASSSSSSAVAASSSLSIDDVLQRQGDDDDQDNDQDDIDNDERVVPGATTLAGVSTAVYTPSTAMAMPDWWGSLDFNVQLVSSQ